MQHFRNIKNILDQQLLDYRMVFLNTKGEQWLTYKTGPASPPRVGGKVDFADAKPPQNQLFKRVLNSENYPHLKFL
jgi:hypothetical protein